MPLAGLRGHQTYQELTAVESQPLGSLWVQDGTAEGEGQERSESEREDGGVKGGDEE